MADTTFSDEFLGHNCALSDHDDITSSDDSNDEDPMLSTHGVDYTPLEHVYDNRSNRVRGNVRWRLCFKSSLGSRQECYTMPPAMPIFRSNFYLGLRFLSPRACIHRGPRMPPASSVDLLVEDITARTLLLTIITCMNRTN